MACEAFKNDDIGINKLKAINQANEIVEHYQGLGLKLTLRQLYYQFVSRNWITNEEKSYKWLGKVVSEGRLNGLIDWDAIEDRGRVIRRASEWDGLGDLTNSALASYRLPRWEGQEWYVELWAEKQALESILDRIAREYHIPLMVNKGYSSSSAMYEAAQRFNDKENHARCIIYVGDFDPSGEDMVRDIAERMEMFGVSGLKVNKIALTMAQIEEFDAPPNPAKLSDSRSPKYIAEHGDSSWEVDAIPPEELPGIVSGAIEEYCDMDLMDAVKAKEEEDKKMLMKAVSKLERKS